MKYKTLDTLTVGEYQELYKIHSSDDDEVDKSIASVALIGGITRWEVEELPLKTFNEANREIVTIFTPKLQQSPVRSTIKLDGTTYKIALNPKELTAGQYIDFQHFIKGGLINNLDKLAACLLVPEGGKYSGEKHEAVSELVSDAPFLSVHGFCVFFLNLWNGSMVRLEPYLKSQLMKNPETMKHLQEMDSRNITDGFIMPNEYPISSGLN